MRWEPGGDGGVGGALEFSVRRKAAPPLARRDDAASCRRVSVHWANQTSITTAVYASQCGLPLHHARLASGCRSALPGRIPCLQGSGERFHALVKGPCRRPPFPGFPWRTHTRGKSTIRCQQDCIHSSRTGLCDSFATDEPGHEGRPKWGRPREERTESTAGFRCAGTSQTRRPQFRRGLASEIYPSKLWNVASLL